MEMLRQCKPADTAAKQAVSDETVGLIRSCVGWDWMRKLSSWKKRQSTARTRIPWSQRNAKPTNKKSHQDFYSLAKAFRARSRHVRRSSISVLQQSGEDYVREAKDQLGRPSSPDR